MDTVSSLSPDSPANKGLDYSYLRAEGIALVQQLSGSIWTDYNEHDPGVTTLEQLCYALTELSYRAELPIADLLTNPANGSIEINRHGLYSDRQILPCDAVTVNDYRKLTVDQVPGVRNAWFYKFGSSPNRSSDETQQVRGLYDVRLYAPEAKLGIGGEEGDVHTELRHQFRWAYNQSRNLCEDLHSVTVLTPKIAVVHAEVDVKTSDSADQVMAQILFELGILLAPELQRESLGTCVRSGLSPTEIFNGPLLEHGFISNEQLQDQISMLAVNEVASAIAEVAGVLGVRNVFVTSEGVKYGSDQTIPIPDDKYLRLDTRFLTDKGRFPIELFVNGVPCKLTPDLVEIELSLLQHSARRAYPLDAQYHEYFGLPTGERMDLLGYYSIQDQYPNTYGISSYGLPANSTPKRMAQAKQLKGYLLVFEQLMADYFAQVAHVKDLFWADAGSLQTYFWQSLSPSVPDVGPILREDYLNGLNDLVTSGPQTPRRAAFLEYLLSLYANELTSMTDNGSSSRTQDLRLIRARQQFLDVLAKSTRTRGRGFDVLERPSPTNFAGMQYKCMIQMGLDLERHRSLKDCLDSSEVSLRKTDQNLFGSRVEDRKAKGMENAFRPISSFPKPLQSKVGTSLLKGMTLTEELLSNLKDPDNLFVGRFPGDSSYHLVYRDPSCGEWIIIALFIDLIEALLEAYALILMIEMLLECTTQLYIVEHILLRPRGPIVPIDDYSYSFTLTAVVGLPWKERTNPSNQKVVREIILENTPAHIVAETCFLDAYQMLEFEVLYFLWREALLTHNPLAIDEASQVMKSFLQTHSSVALSPTT